MLENRNQSCCGMTLREYLRQIFLLYVGPSTILTGISILPGSPGLTETEEAEIETIRQHRQELLEDIKVRTILLLPSA